MVKELLSLYACFPRGISAKAVAKLTSASVYNILQVHAYVYQQLLLDTIPDETNIFKK